MIYGECCEKHNNTQFEDKILRQVADEDKSPVVQACQMLRDVLRCSNMVQNAQTWSKVLWDGPWCSDMPQNRGHGLCRWVRLGVGLETQPRSGWDQYTEPAKHLPSWTLSLSPELLRKKTWFWREDCYNASESIHISVDGGISILTADQFVFFTVSILICLTSITNSFPKTSMSLIQSSLIYI